MRSSPSTKPALPIVEVREAFSQALATADPVVVVAPTGSGKSTTLPGWLADDLGGPVLVVEPRRVACRALATWVATQRGTKLGADVGYRVRFDDRSTADTQILFVTPGVALNLLADDGATKFAAILVDEFHERSWEIDMVVALARYATQRGSTRKLVLCSATLDTESLVETLGAQRVEAQGRRFPVEVEYRGDGIPTPRDLESRVAAAVHETVANGLPGDVLVFLPGKGEIERCSRALREPSVTVVAVHGGLPPDALMRAFAGASGRRVFLATNVAETSLTLPGVTTVIDSGLARRRQHQAGRSVLALTVISQASMDQRAGRAGRVAQGRCIRLWEERFSPEAVTPPEIARVELDDLVVRAAQCGLSADAIAGAPWVESPPAFALRAAIDRLRAAGTLDADGHLTPQGKSRARLPVSPFSARILADPPKALAMVLADIVTLVELRRDLVLGSASGDGLDEERRELFGGALDEVEVQLRALWRGRARAHGLHPAALAEARKLSRTLRRAVGAAGEGEPVFDRAVLAPYLLARVPEAAFVPRPRAAKKSGRDRGGPRRGPTTTPWGNGTIEVGVRPLWTPGLHEDEQPKAPEAALILDLEWLGHGRSASGRGRLILRCTPADLHGAGLGEATAGQPIKSGGHVVADVEQRYAGVLIHRDRERLRGDALCDGIATLIMQGRLRKGLGDAIADDIHLWSLVEGKGQGETQSVPTPKAYLSECLRTAGLSSLAELRLLEPEDLRPDVTARALVRGIGPTELQSLRADFPRQFTFGGNVYDCHVELSARRVTLEAVIVRGKGSGEPPVRVLPRFGGFSVHYRKASRQLRLR